MLLLVNRTWLKLKIRCKYNFIVPITSNKWHWQIFIRSMNMLMSFYIFPSGLEFDLDNINKNLGKKITFFRCNSIILIGMKTLLLEWCVVFSSRKQKNCCKRNYYLTTWEFKNLIHFMRLITPYLILHPSFHS